MIKRMMILCGLFCICNTACAQDFFKDYKQYLLDTRYTNNRHTKKYVKSSISRLKETIHQFELKNGRNFLSDTLFMIRMYGMETGEPSLIIWGSNGSCYYHYYSLRPKKLEVLVDATNKIKEIDPKFKAIVISGDIEAFKNYDNRHRVLDGEGITFTKAIRGKEKWTFVGCGSHGGMDIYNSFGK